MEFVFCRFRLNIKRLYAIILNSITYNGKKGKGKAIRGPLILKSIGGLQGSSKGHVTNDLNKQTLYDLV